MKKRFSCNDLSLVVRILTLHQKNSLSVKTVFQIILGSLDVKYNPHTEGIHHLCWSVKPSQEEEH